MIIFLKGFIKLGIVTKAKQFCDFINMSTLGNSIENKQERVDFQE